MTYRDSLSQLEKAHNRAVLRLCLVRTVWMALLLASLGFLADLLFILPDRVRFDFALGSLGFLAILFLGSFWWLRRARSRARMLVRLIEEANPDLDNALINATDFEEALKNRSFPELSSHLMQEEITKAASRLTTLPDLKALRPRSLKTERNLLLALGLYALLGAILAPSALRALIPRFFDPFGDHPPYQTLVFKVEPEGATVDYGENLKVSVKTEGGDPEAASLVLRDLEGNEISESPMFHEAEGAYFQTIENVERDLEYFIRIDRGRSHRYRLSVNKTPRILDVVATYHPPAYTFLDSSTTLLAEPLLKGYLDTGVHLSVSSNRPLAGGSLEVAGQEYLLEPGDESKAVVAFPLKEEGSFRLTVEDIDGNRSHPEYLGKIEIMPDEKPEVTLSEPGMDSFAVPDSKVPIAIDAFDDLGLTQIAIFRSHNGSDDMKKVLFEGGGDRSQISVTETLDLEDLGVHPGDTIDYYATATDSRPDAPQTVATQAFRLAIISFEEYREFVQSQMTATDLKEKYDRFLDEMEELARAQETLQKETQDLQEKAAQEGGLSPEDRDRLEKVQTDQKELEEWAKKLAEILQEESEKRAIFDVESEYKEALKAFSAQMKEAGENMQKAREALAKAASGDPSDSPPNESSSPSLGLAAEQQKEALKNLKKSLEEYEKKISEPNENLEKVAHVIADTERFKYLYTLQKSLERQIRYYKDMEDPSLDDRVRLKELSEQQSAVRGELGVLKESFETHADELEGLADEQKPSGGE